MAAPAAGAIQGHVIQHTPLMTAAQLQDIVDGLPAMIQAAVQAAIAPLLAAVAPAAVASTAVRIADARRFNCGRRSAFRIVPCFSGADPVHWPHGLTHALVMDMPRAQLNELLR